MNSTESILLKNKEIKCPYKAPDKYFDSLHERVVSNVKKQNIRKKKVLRIRIIESVSAVAACAVILFYVLSVNKQAETVKPAVKINETEEDVIISSVSQNQIVDYLVYQNNAEETLTNEEKELINFVSQQNDDFFSSETVNN